ncbi:MAG: hypothetical protein VYA30_14645 [Myxococcota bacterium]|nr:hypothetical protein [Myxococcota bacterium]
MSQPVLAETDPLDPLADDTAVETKKEKAQAPAVKDPDPALKKMVDEARETTEKRLNRLQSAVQEYADIEEAVGSASNLFLEAMNTYYMTHSAALDAYQTAEASGDQKATKKTGKAVVKIRKNLLKVITKVNKSLKKLKKLEKKLAKQAAEEAKEDAKKGPKDASQPKQAE